MGVYVEAATLRESAQQEEASPLEVWDRLASAVSRLFDRECEVDDDFFEPAGLTATARSYRTNGTAHLQLDPYIPGSIAAIEVAASPLTLGSDDEYIESGGYLIFEADYFDRTPVAVTARWGFQATPAEVVQACTEQALSMWRRQDLAFADMSGISSAALAAEMTPTFRAVTRRYREIYSRRGYFT